MKARVELVVTRTEIGEMKLCDCIVGMAVRIVNYDGKSKPAQIVSVRGPIVTVVEDAGYTYRVHHTRLRATEKGPIDE
jgi:hypothetical protein